MSITPRSIPVVDDMMAPVVNQLKGDLFPSFVTARTAAPAFASPLVTAGTGCWVEGNKDGVSVGKEEGDEDGNRDGASLGKEEGDKDGTRDGASLGISLRHGPSSLTDIPVTVKVKLVTSSARI